MGLGPGSCFDAHSYPSPNAARLKHPLVLCILDGWGIGNPHNPYNAIAAAHTPHWDRLMATYPHTQLHASGPSVGLPEGQMGNSEVGHLTLGSGRKILQELPRISQALAGAALSQNPAFHKLVSTLKATGGACHVMGLFSDGGIHSHLAHLITYIKELHANQIPIYLHCFSDGRDTEVQAGLALYTEFIKSLPNSTPAAFIKEATLCGRFYSMDRDHRWERTEAAYNLIIHGKGHSTRSMAEGFQEAYAQNLGDEMIPPCVVEGYPGVHLEDGLLCFNFRGDRVRQLLSSFFNPQFSDFPRSSFPLFSIGCAATVYSKELCHDIETLFPREKISQTLGEILSDHHLSQLRLAETEKFAHVSYFFNGGQEKEFLNEYRLLIPSPKAKNYKDTPEMAAPLITTCLTQALREKRFDVIIVNYANADMVGHTGDFEATVHSIEALDRSLGAILEIIQSTESTLIITADHGNAEEMRSPEGGQIKTSHTTNLVPFIVANAPHPMALLQGPSLSLADVAPTVLDLLGLTIPPIMSGISLIDKPPIL